MSQSLAVVIAIDLQAGELLWAEGIAPAKPWPCGLAIDVVIHIIPRSRRLEAAGRQLVAKDHATGTRLPTSPDALDENTGPAELLSQAA